MPGSETGKWVEHLEDYEYSIARYYVKNKLDGFVLIHFEELYYYGLSKPASLVSAQGLERIPHPDKKLLATVSVLCQPSSAFGQGY